LLAERASQPDVTALYLYDAVTIFMNAADETLAAGGDFRDGRLAFNRLNNRIFKGN